MKEIKWIGIASGFVKNNTTIFNENIDFKNTKIIAKDKFYSTKLHPGIQGTMLDILFSWFSTNRIILDKYNSFLRFQYAIQYSKNKENIELIKSKIEEYKKINNLNIKTIEKKKLYHFAYISALFTSAYRSGYYSIFVKYYIEAETKEIFDNEDYEALDIISKRIEERIKYIKDFNIIDNPIFDNTLPNGFKMRGDGDYLYGSTLGDMKSSKHLIIYNHYIHQMCMYYYLNSLKKKDYHIQGIIVGPYKIEEFEIFNPLWNCIYKIKVSDIKMNFDFLNIELPGSKKDSLEKFKGMQDIINSLKKKQEDIQESDKNKLLKYNIGTEQNMSKFIYDKNQLLSVDQKLADKPEYQKLLNNLLGISRMDQAIFASSKSSMFDLKSIASESMYDKAFDQPEFSLSITNIKNDEVIQLLEESDSIDDFLNIVEINSIFLSIADRELLSKNYKGYKEKIITKLKKNKNESISRWKQFKHKYTDKQAQINSWPLYVGTMFLKVKNYNATLYAPLILKKVDIEISSSNKVTLRSIDDSIEINDKLLFLLKNQYKFELPKIDNEAKISFNEVIEEFRSCLSDLIVNHDINFKDKFHFETKATIKNGDLLFSPGAALMIVSPTGGELRNKLIELINKDEIEDLLDIDLSKNIQKEVLNELENRKGIWRITKTDVSQEKAIMGALKDSAIIWGPPGTGKSQTIVNIIANLLYADKSIIITSEKKAALDVIKDRMGSLGKFLFFGLTDKKVDKEEFYKPFRSLVSSIYDVNGRNSLSIILNDGNHDNKEQSYFSDNDFNYYKQSLILKTEQIDSLIFVNTKLNSAYNNLIDAIYKYHAAAVHYLSRLRNWKEGDTFKTWYKNNKISKGPVFFIGEHHKSARLIKKMFKKTKGDIEFIQHLSNIQDINNIKLIDKFCETELKYSTSRDNYKSDIEFLDDLLTIKLKNKIANLNKDPNLKKTIDKFMKEANSGWRVPYKFINFHRETINILFSAFISTPTTLSTMIDLNKKYDYAIFDEASQMHTEKAIPYIAIAEKSIIAGDSQQMRPTSFFEKRDNEKLVNDAEETADSLLDYAYRKGLNGVREYMLTKNYRSNYSELMNFSSKHFYDNKLDVIDHFKSKNKDSIEVIEVNGEWQGNMNEKEARELLSIALGNCHKYKKIILLTFNVNQKQYIESLIYSDSKYQEIVDAFAKDSIVLRNLENIQGDEANLVIVSVAYDKTAHLGSTYVARPEGKNALNVAISRAIDKMIVLKSINSEDVKGNTKNESLLIFKQWLHFLESSKDERKGYLINSDEKHSDFDSEFEIEVYQYLSNNLILPYQAHLETQYVVGSYKIDIAIINQKAMKFIYGIEVDGYKYHSGFVKTIRDIERQRFLEAKGYPIYRVTELQWKTNKEGIIKELEMVLGE